LEAGKSSIPKQGEESVFDLADVSIFEVEPFFLIQIRNHRRCQNPDSSPCLGIFS
jgi:hypothetical protein